MRIKIADIFFQRMAKSLPGLSYKLKQADMPYKVEEFIKKTMLSSFYLTFGVTIFLFLLLAKFKLAKILFFIFPATFFLAFFYLIKFPDIKIRRIERDISREIVFASRFITIEIESGVTLYDALVNVAKNYKAIGKYLGDITRKVDLGTAMEDALNEAVEINPSKSFRRILWQVINSLRTGSDISMSLNIVIEQIAKEQNIEVQKYGRKLNPLAMFYMIIAVILPSLGITMLIVLSTFVEFELSLAILLFIAFFLGFVQFMFLAIIKFSRPAVEL